jgi:putative FmdB family regulatory protein
MPTYEYNCVTCETSQDITRKFEDPENLPSCPICGYHMTRVYSPTGIQFKGSGFYKTDNG